jgi:hypothetical protein
MLVEPVVNAGLLVVKALKDAQPGVEACQPTLDALKTATQVRYIGLQSVELRIHAAQER